MGIRPGFSLVEMMITVLVMAILAGMAVPMLGSTGPSRLRAAARLLAADLAYAQNESISHGDDLRMAVFDLDADSYRLVASSDPDTPLAHPVGGLPYAVTFGQGRAAAMDGVQITALSMDGDPGGTDDRMQFGLYGQLDQGADAVITLGIDAMRISVTVDASTGETTIGDVQ